jgi:hypothetical protein
MASLRFRAAAELFDTLRRDVTTAAPTIFSLDGWPGSGKSFLGREMAIALTATCLHLDDYVEPDQGKFIEALDYEALALRIRLPAETPYIVIVEGVCIQQVLENLGVVPRRRIYLKLLSSRGDWPEGEHLDQTAEQMAIESEALRQMQALHGEEYAQGDLPQLEQEVRRYHREYRPHDLADYVYERIVDD